MIVSTIRRSRRDESGFALPAALGVLIMCVVITAIIVSSTGAGERASTTLAKQRNDVYAVNGALDAAIKWVQSDATRGADAGSGVCSGGTTTPYFTTTVNGQAVQVTCTPDTGSGGSATTTKPGFAILALAPYHGPWSVGQNPSCHTAHDEVGIVETQDTKLLTVTGDVLVNADVDADTYNSSGCPNVTAAQPIVVIPTVDAAGNPIPGQVILRESYHDICTGTYPKYVLNGQIVPQGTPGASQAGDYDPKCQPYASAASNPFRIDTSPNTYVSQVSNAQLATSDPLHRLEDPGLADAGQANPTSAWRPNFTSATLPVARSVPACPAPNANGVRLVTFQPGTYTDAAGLTNLMTNTDTHVGCPNAVFWFQPGNYYFNFGTNSAADEWTIDDSSARVIGGQANTNVVAPATTPETWRPITVDSGTQRFGNPTTDGLNINGVTTNAPLTAGQTAKITLSGFNKNGDNVTPPGIPADATINSALLRVAHGEDNPAAVQNATVTITTADGTSCAAVPVTPRATMGEDPAYDVTSCLIDATKTNGNLHIAYSVTANGATTARLDGIWLDITYTTAGRPAWNPANPATLTQSSPWVPGACLHDGDHGGWSAGVQFVFGGDSRVNLKSGKVELCDQPSTTHQEIVLYGVRGPTASSPQSATLQASNATATAGAWTGIANGTTINSQSASTGFSGTASGAGTTRTVSLTNFTPAMNIDPASTGFSTSLRIAHSENNSTAQSRINNQKIVVMNAAGTTNYCTITVSDTTSLNPQTPAIPAGCLTIARLNAGIQLAYSVTYTCSSSCGTSTYTEALDGIDVSVNWTPPATGGGVGGLAPESGCLLNTDGSHPYYNPNTHEPGYNGACALMRVSGNGSAGGHYPRVLTLWGTVYAPSAALDVPVDILTVPVFNRGVVARMLMLGYNVANNALVSITTTPEVGQPNNRKMVLTATIPGKTTTATAHIEVCDLDGADPTNCPSGDGSVKTLSWRLDR